MPNQGGNSAPEFAFSGTLLSGPELREQLLAALRLGPSPIVIATAFLKASALRWLTDFITANASVIILARWQFGDLLNGASDLEAYTFATERGWSFLISNDFHGKVYMIGHLALFVGSSNMTSKGLSLGDKANDEVNVRALSSEANHAAVGQILARATPLTPELFAKIKSVVDLAPKANTPPPSWPIEVRALMKPPTPPQKLTVAECFQSKVASLQRAVSKPGETDESLAHDLSILGLRSALDVEKIELQTRLRETKMICWLVHRLQTTSDRQLYFGALSAALHDSLLDDPKPYRRDVKDLAANLLAWIEVAELPEFEIDRPNHSQRISLK